MEVKFYMTKSSNNTINKELENETVYDIKFKDRVDITRPIIKLQVESFGDLNYCYIPDFNRYYFIDDVIIERTGIYVISLSVDVLESFKNDIMNCWGYINQQEKVNPYYDSGYRSETKKEIDIFESDVIIEMDSNLMVTVIGGVF